MSKMEDKLKASIQPKQPAARAKAQPKSSSPKKAVVRDADLNAPDIQLHPSRIWPD